MAKWILAMIFILILPFAAYSQDNTKVMQTWVRDKFGVSIPNPELKQSWSNLPMMNGCQYEWNVQWKDAKFQVKDGNDNYYRVYYQGNTLTLDFKRDFNGFFGG